MKVLQINSVCGVGSTGRIATDIADVLRKNGHESYIAYGYGDSSEVNSYKIEGNFGLKCNIIKTRLLGKHGFYNKMQTKRLIKWIDTINPDIIHLHNIHGHYVNVEILFNYLNKINKPIVWTLHDCWAFTGHCAYFDYVNCNKWKNGCNSCPQKKSYPNTWLFDRSKEAWRDKKNIFNKVKNITIVTPSKWLGDLVKESYLKHHPIQVINNGIDLDIFQYMSSKFIKELGISKKYIILGVASQWDRRKGYQFMPEIADRLGEEYQLVLVGLTEKQKEQLTPNILGITKTNNVQELAAIYSVADVFINPTLEDNFPTTNIEALACGTPVITFNTGGSVECVEGECGGIVEKGNLEELVKEVKNIIRKKVDRKVCRERAKLYNKKHRYMDYIKLYQELIRNEKL